MVIPSAGSPQGDHADAEEHEARGDRQESGEVVAADPDVLCVVRGLGTAEQAEEAEQEREHSAKPGPQSAVRGSSGDDQGQRHKATDQMVHRRGARLGLKEVVVDDVQADDAESHASNAHLGSNGRRSATRGRPGLGDRMREGGYCRSPIVRSKKPTTRRSYSSGAASKAPVWPPGAGQYSFGPFAAS